MSLDQYIEDLKKLDINKMKLVKVDTEKQRKLFDYIVETYHSYVPRTSFTGRRLDYLIMIDDKCIGAIGIGSAILALKERDDYIGWNKETRLKNLNMVANNWRFTLTDEAPKNSGTKALSLLYEQAKQDWMKYYGDKLVLLETLVEAPHRGTVYKASGWKYLGKTKGYTIKWIPKNREQEYIKKGWSIMQRGDNFHPDKIRIAKKTSSKKYIFIKPLNKAWRKYLLGKIEPSIKPKK
jgi:hypothetical protein